MVTEIPTELFKLLKDVIGENIKKYDIEMVNNDKGQGFVCEVIFFNLLHQQTRDELHLIVKQEQKVSKETEEDFNIVIQNEMNFYESIWPFLQKYFKNVSGKDSGIIPKCFGTSHEGCRKIILENIKPQGYVMYDKTKQLDDDHFRTIFKTYGIYHGISMALREQDSEQYNRLVSMLTKFFKKVYNDENHPFCKGYTNCFRNAQEYFDPVQENHLLEKLRLYEESGIELLRQCVNEEFPKGVILHGDCWSNNMMFKYDEQGKPQDVKIIDFQTASHGSLVFDLSYCLYSGGSEKTLAKLDDYLKIYHRSLSDTLSKFGLSAETVYSFDTLKEEWKKFCKYGFPLGLHIMEMKLVDSAEIPDLTKDLNISVKLSDQKREIYKKQVRDLVLHFYNNNFF